MQSIHPSILHDLAGEILISYDSTHRHTPRSCHPSLRRVFLAAIGCRTRKQKRHARLATWPLLKSCGITSPPSVSPSRPISHSSLCLSSLSPVPSTSPSRGRVLRYFFFESNSKRLPWALHTRWPYSILRTIAIDRSADGSQDLTSPLRIPCP